MSLLSSIFHKKERSAAIAKERLLGIIVVKPSEVDDASAPDFLPQLQKEIMEVVCRYIKVDTSRIKLSVDKQEGCEILELNIPMPDGKQDTPPAWRSPKKPNTPF